MILSLRVIDLVAGAALVGVVGGGVVTVTTGMASGAAASAYPTPVSSPLAEDPAPPTELVSADPYVAPSSEADATKGRTTAGRGARAATRLAATPGEFAPHAGLGGFSSAGSTGWTGSTGSVGSWSTAAPARPASPAPRAASGGSTGGSTGGSKGGSKGGSTGGTRTEATTEVTVSSFNVLGGSHTRGRGKKARFAPGPVRAGYAAQLVEQRDVDLVGFQELEGEQARVVRDRLPGYAMFPGPQARRHASSNSIMWRTDTWRAVETHTIGIPYFHGKITQMPYVRLQNLATGTDVWVANFHNPASTRKRGNQARWRRAATDREIALANRLRAETGLPVIFTGDMNEREEYFCRVVGATELESSAGGSASDSHCSVPRNTRIDWIFGTPELHWLSHELDKSALVRRTTDHPMVVARATLRVSTGS